MSTFNGVRVFSASTAGRRAVLDAEVTRWLEEARRTGPGFELIEIVVRQSSDYGFHCLSICLFYREPIQKKAPCLSG